MCSTTGGQTGGPTGGPTGCQTGCQKDRAFAVLRDDRLLRLSFSESVCRAICDKTPGAVVERVTLRVGAEIPFG
jgi:hypothetical protein